MNVFVVPVQREGLLRGRQSLDHEHLVVVLALRFAMVMVSVLVMLLTVSIIVALVGVVPVVMVAVMVGVGLEMNFAAHLLEMKVAIEVVLQPQHALAALVRPQNEEGSGGPARFALEGKPAILVEPEAARLAILSRSSTDMSEPAKTASLWKSGCFVLT